MKSAIIFLLSFLLFPYQAKGGNAVYKCKSGGQYTYQSKICDDGLTVQKINPVTIKPDPATVERLKQQNLDYLKSASPSEYRRLMREKMLPTERLVDERMEEQERLQKMQMQLELQQRERHQREILQEMENQQAQTLQLEKERLEIERQRLIQLWRFPPPINPPTTPIPDPRPRYPVDPNSPTHHKQPQPF